MSTNPVLSKLDLENGQYVNVTDSFLRCIDSIQGNQVVQSKFFNLLEGTRAVEVSNRRLDTGLIPLEDYDLSFDTSAPRSNSEVIAIMDQFLRTTMSWLQNSSLPVTALSCRYAQTLLQNYQRHPDTLGTLTNCTLIEPRLKAGYANHGTEDLSPEYMLVHQVLRSFLLVMLKWIGFCVQVGLNVLYEEEDLTTRTLDLDILTAVPFEVVAAEASKSMDWIASNIGDDKHAGVMQKFLALALDMLNLHQILYLRLSLTEKDQIEDKLHFLYHGKQCALNLQQETAQLPMEPPKGSFSKFIQLDLNNKSIPAELTSLSRDECYSSIISLFDEVYQFVNTAANITNIHQLNTYLEFEIRRPLASANVISRGLFQLFLVRDDRTILGSKADITSISLRLMENLSCLYSHALRPDSWNNIQGDETQVLTVKRELLQNLDTLLGDIETGINQYFALVSNNRCRQRQLLTRSILIWDTIQVSSEPLEVMLWQSHRIGDRLLDDSPALAITSFVYYTKLDVMLEVLLLGFELDLYKPYEMNQMYWFATYLSTTIVDHLKGRVLMIIRLQIHEICDAMPKRLKKAKAGPKKQQLKAQIQFATTNILPGLQGNQEYLERFLIRKYEAMRIITDAYRMMYAICHRLKLIDAIGGPKNLITSRELLYNIRMKPWSSVGVPALPTYDQYVRALRKSAIAENTDAESQITSAMARFNEARQTLQELGRETETSPNYCLGTHCTEYYTNMTKTCVVQSLELHKLRQAVVENKLVKTKIVNNSDYFPTLEISV